MDEIEDLIESKYVKMLVTGMQYLISIHRISEKKKK